MKNGWVDYRLECGDDIKRYFSEIGYDNNKYLYILGAGFDERMCDGIDKVVDDGMDLSIWKIQYDEGKKSPSNVYRNRLNDNLEKLSQILKGKTVIDKTIEMWKEDEGEYRYVAEINANKLIKNSKTELENFTDIIIDISALPQSIYYCLVNMILREYINEKRIYVIVSENYVTDMCTVAVEPDEFAHEIHGFTGPSDDMNDHIIWFPVLGETNKTLLQKYYDFLTTDTRHIDEICPVFPFPSVDIKRSDQILEEYRKELFSQWETDKKNIVFASETNPFQVYRQLIEAAEHYLETLRPIGNCKFVFSTITSKLMSIGTLLAAFDLKTSNCKVGFLNIKNKGYIIQSHEHHKDIENQVYCLCLTDDGY